MAPLHTCQTHPRAAFNRLHFLLYSSAIAALFYRHIAGFSASAAPSSLLLLLADAIFAIFWIFCQGLRWLPLRRREFPSRLPQVTGGQGLPALDVFICTADPFKEPPASVASTALSVMAYDYPADRLSVYVSDDGGSELTLFAFMEAAKFARHWLPFCREKGVMVRSPEAYFESNGGGEAEKMKAMFEDFREKVESAVNKGHVDLSMIDSPEEKAMFAKWKGFARRDHPSVVKVLCESNKDKDIAGHPLPNLIYMSREKRPSSPHHFKAGALNSLIRVSEVMTNAPVFLILDCDMYSNDPNTVQRALCYLLDPDLAPNFAYVQFPQKYRGINTDDIYGGENRRLFLTSPRGFDGQHGCNFFGTGGFFSRRSLYGPPATAPPPSDCESKAGVLLRSEHVLQKAHDAASCKFEHVKEWGSKIGFRYGSLVEDYYTGYILRCEGWQAVFCNPDRPAFLGDAPKTLHESLSQAKRWVVGFYEVGFSRYSPLFYGIKKTTLLAALCNLHHSFWGLPGIGLIVYGLLPQLFLFYDKPLFPKASDPWFFLYAYLFVAAYAHDFIEYIEFGGSFWKWWNDQRMFLIRGATAYAFGTLEFVLNRIGVSAPGFNVTSKSQEEEENKLYDNGMFAFGKSTPFFISLGTIATVNLISLIYGLTKAARTAGAADEMFLQLLLCGFVAANSWPVYKAMFVRKDGGRIPRNVTNTSILLACTFFYAGKVII
uniref:Cellulose synthase-like protein G3 n=1 Tax=Anoectochilus roxburghii TaxID=569774 RepID=A0AAU8GRF2_9ASPA